MTHQRRFSSRSKAKKSSHSMAMSSDGGVILVKQADDILGLSRRFAACFRDKRHPGFVEYRVED
ncbi:transposase, partial [Acetobacter estunensis]|uniref:transposase n=1 Tax=Acetobacter estunensis TaxID=104097 RepID=UPI00266F9143